jgi:phosphatidylglycerophosphatase A
MKKQLSFLCATVFYVGHLPGPRGTYAAALTTAVYFLIFRATGRVVPELHISLLCLITTAGVLASQEVSKHSGHHDPQIVVVDEVAGQLLTFLFLPVNYWNLCLGLALFRLFDIWKPYPIRHSERLPNGVGIMADDLVAGIYANATLHIAGWLLRSQDTGAFLWLNS